MSVIDIVVYWLRFVLELLAPSRIRGSLTRPLAAPALALDSTASTSSSLADNFTGPSRSPPPPADPTREARRLRAKRAGEQALAKKQGRQSWVEKTPQRPGGGGKPQFYCVVRAAANSGQAPTVVRSWDECRSLIARGKGFCPHAIFHSFIEQHEAEAYWLAAEVGDFPVSSGN